MLQHTKAIRESLESKLRQLWTASDEERKPFIDALNDLNKNERIRNNTNINHAFGKTSSRECFKFLKIIEGNLEIKPL